jgi:DNA-binding GntR family transcriptional regulator
MSAPARGRTSNLGVRVYRELRSAIIKGRYLPGQKITIRSLAQEYGTSLTPAREALHYLVAEGVLVSESNRSARIPVMTGDRIRELRDIRMSVEGLAAARASARITAKEIQRLRRLAGDISAARARGDMEIDIVKLTEFQFSVYRASHMSQLIKLIETLWLQTGPYLKLLYPDYTRSVGSRRGDWRDRLCKALKSRNADAARHEIESDVGEALDYLAKLADAAALMRAPPPRNG